MGLWQNKLQSKAALQINFQKCTNNSVSSIVQYSSIMSFGSDVLLAVSHHTCLVKFTINRLLAASRHQASLANAIAFANLGEHSGGHSCPSSSATNRDSRPVYQNTAECIYDKAMGHIGMVYVYYYIKTPLSSDKATVLSTSPMFPGRVC